MKKKFVLLICIILMSVSISGSAFGFKVSKRPKHPHSESSYQHAWCKLHNGVEEYKTNEKTRVDCLTSTHAVEFDFAEKWAESVGQALHYEIKTGKRAMVVLIMENPTDDMMYYPRVDAIARKHNFDLEYITPSILDIKRGKCQFSDCKCHR